MAEPKVRFKRDDGSSYPAWVAGKLGDITTKVDRKAPKGSVAPVMMVSQGNGFIYQADKYSRENAGQSLKNYTLLKQGEFAYNHGASKAKPYGVAYCLTEEPEARVPFVYHTFKLKDGVNSYWHEALNTSKMDRQLKRMVSSGARMDGLLNINYETYMDVDINIPCVEEQQKIADFLSSVDEIITASEEEVANLETQKKAVMKKIFSQEVRFKRVDGSDFPEWEDIRFGDVFTEIVRKTSDTETYPLYSLTIEDGVTEKTERYERSYLVKKAEDNYKIVPPNAFVYNPMNLRFGALAPNHTNKEVSVSQYYNVFSLKDETVLGFWESYLVNDEMLKYYFSIATGSLVEKLRVHYSNFVNIVKPLPCLEEQRLIADFLSDFDEAIAAAKKELELWKVLKKGLLQQMFV